MIGICQSGNARSGKRKRTVESCGQLNREKCMFVSESKQIIGKTTRGVTSQICETCMCVDKLALAI